MTLKEAIAVLAAKDPSRSYSITKDVWSHRPITPDGARSEDNSEYRVAILPGFKGSPCDQARHTTIEGVLERALAIFPSYTADTNEE